MLYVDCVRKNTAIMPIEEAVVRAVEECIERDILAEFLRKNRAEVIPLSIFEYNEEETLKLIKRDEFEMGWQKGMEEGIEEGIEQSISLVIETCAELGLSKEKACEKVREKFGLEEAKTQGYLDRYWK